MRTDLVNLCKKYRIEITASLIPTPSALQAVVIFADLDNPAILQKYGLTPLEDEEEEKKELPTNPLRN
jgi:hypothetical protein